MRSSTMRRRVLSEFSPGVRRLRVALIVALTLCFGLFVVTPALAVKSVRVSVDADAIDLTSAVDRYSGQGDKISVYVAPGPD